MRLYEVPTSPGCRKIRAIAHELGMSFESVLVDLRVGAQRAPEYLAMNPNAKVPVLEDGDFVLWESNAICCYLAAKDPEHRLLPVDPRGRASVDKWLHWLNAHLAISIGKVARERIYKLRDGGIPDETVAAEGLAELTRWIGVLDAALAGRAWLAGADLTVADYAVAAHLTARSKLGLDTSAFANVQGWLDRVEGRDAWTKARAGEPA